jgi:hypothetical protein
VDVKFPVKKKALDEYEDLEDPNKRERLQVAWGKMHEPDDEFHFGRNGDHCMVPFECDLCVFRKLHCSMRYLNGGPPVGTRCV